MYISVGLSKQSKMSPSEEFSVTFRQLAILLQQITLSKVSRVHVMIHRDVCIRED